MDRLAAMKAFVTVINEGSFTAAASKLRTSKSVVSTLIRDLEADLGTALMIRTTRRMSLTEAGARYKARAEQILHDVEAAGEEATALTLRPRGILRISAGVSFGSRYMGAALASFAERYPDVNIDLTLADRFVDLVDEGIDVAVRIGKLADSTLIARRLTYTSRVVCASPGYIARHGRPQHPKDLSRHNCLNYSLLSSGNHWQFLEHGREITVAVSGALNSNNGDLLREAAVHGLGLHYSPKFLVHEDLKSGHLVSVLDDFIIPPLEIHAVFPGSRFISAKVRAFVDHMAGFFGDPPPWE